VVIITSHNALDFDGLAAMVAAQKLFPAAVMVFSGTLSKNVKKFMALYKDSLDIKYPKEIDLSQVNRMIIVDTANPNRLGYLKDLVFREGMDFYIFDHHPASEGDLRGSLTELHQVGAVTTVLVEKIIENDISVSAFDATILALGIYEDTGSLSFTSTTPRDVSAAAFLLSRGANLSVVANFMEQPFSSQQRQLLQELLSTSRYFKINNMDVVVAVAETDKFIPGLDEVTHRLFEVESSDAIFTVVTMQGKVNVVARSRTGNLKVNELLKDLDGRGHERAASAIVKDKNAEEVIKILMDGLGDKVCPGLLAHDIMSAPVKTIPMYVSMEEAGRIMLRYGHTGLPVVEGDRVVGLISRRDVDKAKTHELGHAPVKGFMTTEVISVTSATPVSEIQKLMIEHDIGRLPVIDNGRLVGIVSRSDILKTLHGQDYPEDHKTLYLFSDNGEKNYAELMQKYLPANIISVLRLAGEVADELGYAVYCVGGFVRDLLLRVANYDVDLVVGGDGIKLAQKLAERLKGRARAHKQFSTAVIVLPDGSKVDVATARTEYYEFPAALPKIERASIKEDLYRRDFTINTLAICLNQDKFGDLIDYFGGRKDLEKGYIRVLYNLSFIEDPTRILRAIRFEQRYHFTIEPDTFRFAKDAIDRRLLGRLSYKRLLQELILIFSEKAPLPALKRMKEIGVWEYIFPEIEFEELKWDVLERVPAIISWCKERYHWLDIKQWLVYMLVIFSGLSEKRLETLLQRYSLNKYDRKVIEDSLKIPVLTEYLNINHNLPPSRFDEMLGMLDKENMIYLLLCIKDELVWENLANYIDLKERISVDINGNNLKELGLKAGPIFRRIFDELYKLKLDGIIHDREDEINTVKKWIEEGKFIDSVVD